MVFQLALSKDTKTLFVSPCEAIKRLGGGGCGFPHAVPSTGKLEMSARKVKLVSSHRALTGVLDATNEKPCLFTSAIERSGRKRSCQLSLSEENAAMYTLNKSQPAENV